MRPTRRAGDVLQIGPGLHDPRLDEAPLNRLGAGRVIHRLAAICACVPAPVSAVTRSKTFNTASKEPLRGAGTGASLRCARMPNAAAGISAPSAGEAKTTEAARATEQRNHADARQLRQETGTHAKSGSCALLAMSYRADCA